MRRAGQTSQLLMQDWRRKSATRPISCLGSAPTPESRRSLSGWERTLTQAVFGSPLYGVLAALVNVAFEGAEFKDGEYGQQRIRALLR